MSQPARLTTAEEASGAGERLIACGRAHRVAVGVLFLALCGCKFTVRYIKDTLLRRRPAAAAAR